MVSSLLSKEAISIHALLAESDPPTQPERHQSQAISIHALLAESDNLCVSIIQLIEHFYPRSPCGERHLRVVDGSKSSIISIHALLAESDPGKVRVVEPGLLFLSTLSLRRATMGLDGRFKL